MAPKTTTILHLPRSTTSSPTTSPHSHTHTHTHSASHSNLLQLAQLHEARNLLILPNSNSQSATSPQSQSQSQSQSQPLTRSSTLQKKNKRRVKALSIGGGSPSLGSGGSGASSGSGILFSAGGELFPHERSASMSSTGTGSSSVEAGVGGSNHNHNHNHNNNNNNNNGHHSGHGNGNGNGASTATKGTYISRVALGLRAFGAIGGSRGNNSGADGSDVKAATLAEDSQSRLYPTPPSTGISSNSISAVVKTPPRGTGANTNHNISNSSRPATPVDVFKPLPSRPTSSDFSSGGPGGLDAPPRSHSRLNNFTGFLSDAHQSLLFVDPEPVHYSTKSATPSPPPANKNSQDGRRGGGMGGGEVGDGGDGGAVKVTKLEPIIPVHLLDQMVSASPSEMSPASTLVNPFFNRTIELERRIRAAAKARERDVRSSNGVGNSLLDLEFDFENVGRPVSRTPRGGSRESSRERDRERERSSSRGRVRVVEIRNTPGGPRVARSLSRSDSQKRLSRARNGGGGGGSLPRAGTSLGLMHPGGSDSRSSSVHSNRRSAIEDGFADVAGLGSEISEGNPFGTVDEDEAEESVDKQQQQLQVQPRGRRRVNVSNPSSGPVVVVGGQTQPPVDLKNYTSAREQIERRRERNRREEREREKEKIVPRERSLSASGASPSPARSRSRSSTQPSRPTTPETTTSNALKGMLADPSQMLRTRLMGGNSRQPRTPSPLRHAAATERDNNNITIAGARLSVRLADMDAISAPTERQRSALAAHVMDAENSEGGGGGRFIAPAAAPPRRKPVPAGFMAAHQAAAVGTTSNNNTSSNTYPTTSNDNSDEEEEEEEEEEDEAVPTPATGTFITPLLPTPFLNTSPPKATRSSSPLSSRPRKPTTTTTSTTAPTPSLSASLTTPITESTISSSYAYTRHQQKRADRALKSVSLMALPPSPPQTSSTLDGLGLDVTPSLPQRSGSTSSATSSLSSVGGSSSSPPISPRLQLQHKPSSNTITITSHQQHHQHSHYHHHQHQQPPLSPPLTEASHSNSTTSASSKSKINTNGHGASPPSAAALERSALLTQQHIHTLESSIQHERLAWEQERKALYATLAHVQGENEGLRELVGQLTERMERCEGVYARQGKPSPDSNSTGSGSGSGSTNLRRAFGMFMLNPRGSGSGEAGRKSPQGEKEKGGAGGSGSARTTIRTVTPGPWVDPEEAEGYQSGRSTPMMRLGGGRKEDERQGNGNGSGSGGNSGGGGRTGGLWKRSAGRAGKKGVVLLVKD